MLDWTGETARLFTVAREPFAEGSKKDEKVKFVELSE